MAERVDNEYPPEATIGDQCLREVPGKGEETLGIPSLSSAELHQPKPFAQLRKRREQVAITLQYIEKQRNEAEQNTDWLDRAAYESRLALLDRLTDWYTEEMEEIDKALEGVENKHYGLCLACHNPIEN